MTKVRAIVRAIVAPARLVLILAIRLYRITLGGLLGGQCRFYPSCSTYAEEAIRELGVLRGVPLSVWRVLRCSPLTKGGVDYPPGHADRGRGIGDPPGIPGVVA